MEDARLRAERGPGSYNPIVQARRPSGPLIPISNGRPLSFLDQPPPRRPESVASSLAADAPTPEVALRLTSTHTYTSACKANLPLPPTARPSAVSSPRKRPMADRPRVPAARAQRTVERLHGGCTSSYAAHRDDRSHQHNSLRWGNEGWGPGSALAKQVLFPAPV